jgi:hypothetical protein
LLLHFNFVGCQTAFCYKISGYNVECISWPLVFSLLSYRGTMWRVILNLLMIQNFINNCSRSFSSHAIERHLVSSFLATSLFIGYACPGNKLKGYPGLPQHNCQFWRSFILPYFLIWDYEYTKHFNFHER